LPARAAFSPYRLLYIRYIMGRTIKLPRSLLSTLHCVLRADPCAEIS
jgi:hypothetical protein